MIISCPSCSTKYNFPDAEYRAGRKVKCKMCGNVFALPEQDEDMELIGASLAEPAKKPAPPRTRQPEDKSLFDPFSDEAEDEEQELAPKAPRGGKPAKGPAEALDDELDEEPGKPSEDKRRVAVEDMTDPSLPEKPAKNVVAQQFSGDDGTGARFDVDALGVPGKKPKSKKGLVILGGFVGLLLGLAVLYYMAPGLFGKFLPMGKSGQDEKTEGFTTDQIKDFALKDVTQYYVDNEKVGKLFVVQGKVVNNFKTPKDLIKIEATLFDKNNAAVVAKKLLIGNTVSLYQLQMLSEQELEAQIENKVGVLTVNTGVPPGGEVPFVVIFYRPSDAVQEFGVKVIEAKDPPKK
jgi:predicted Zn finger-like uncharacterized protein